jgi:hypothetical protein
VGFTDVFATTSVGLPGAFLALAGLGSSFTIVALEAGLGAALGAGREAAWVELP